MQRRGARDCGRLGAYAAGALLVLALLEFSGLTPVSVSARRATFLVYQYTPVTGSWLLDATLVGLLGSTVLVCTAGRSPGAAAGYLAAAAAGGAALAYSPGPLGDAVIAAISLPPLATAWERLRERRLEVAEGAAAAVVVVEGAAAAGIAAYFADPGYGWLAQRLVLVERRLWAIPASTAPFLAAVFGSLWLLCAASRLTGRHWCPLSPRPLRPGRRGIGGAGLLAAWALVAAAVALPHLPSVNPSGRPVSVDTFYYARFLEAADLHGLGWALTHIRGLARAVYLAALYYVHRATGLDPYFMMDVVHPLLAGTALATSAYVLAGRRLGCCRGEAALLAVAGGQYATFLLSGLQANSLALPLGLLYLAAPGYVALAALMLVTALIHPWTHAVYSAALVLDRLWATRSRREAARDALLAAAAFAASDAANRLLAHAAAAGIVAHSLTSGLAQAEPVMGIYWGTLLWSWGSLASSPWVLAVGAAAPFYTPAAAVEAVAAPPALLSHRVIAHRLLLDVPLWLPAAVVAARVSGRLRYALLVAAAVGLLVAVYYAVPLEGPLWESIWARLVEPTSMHTR